MKSFFEKFYFYLYNVERYITYDLFSFAVLIEAARIFLPQDNPQGARQAANLRRRCLATMRLEGISNLGSSLV